jgi:alkanesulfonate monooxygenase SsuD/methylene tetrahydromethanopterin reductase-like flavin-dependent oxidoreductase (luciferase family)
MANELRFGVVGESVPEGRGWLEHARRVEDAGVAALLLRDHFSAGAFGPQLAPFSALAAAAAVTGRLRVGTMVLCNDFRHPIAARHADTVGILPAPIKGSDDSDDPADRLPAAFDDKIATVRAAAGDRFGQLELSAFATFVVTSRRRADTEELIARRGWAGVSVETAWQMPTLFVGSPEQIRADLRERRERFGLSYLITPDHQLPVLAQVISGL